MHKLLILHAHARHQASIPQGRVSEWMCLMSSQGRRDMYKRTMLKEFRWYMVVYLPRTTIYISTILSRPSATLPATH